MYTTSFHTAKNNPLPFHNNIQYTGVICFLNVWILGLEEMSVLEKYRNEKPVQLLGPSEYILIHSFIQYSVWRQVQSLLQNDSSI